MGLIEDIVFWSRVQKTESGCWLWEGTVKKNGYGELVIHKHKFFAHRLSYILAHGSIPKGLCILHSCDNPQCVNPAHLRAGTMSENSKEAYSKGRLKRVPIEKMRRGERHGQAKLTDAKVIQIRQRFTGGETNRTLLAKEYGVCLQTICGIVNGKRWQHLEEERAP